MDWVIKLKIFLVIFQDRRGNPPLGVRFT